MCFITQDKYLGFQLIRSQWCEVLAFILIIFSSYEMSTFKLIIFYSWTGHMTTFPPHTKTISYTDPNLQQGRSEDDLPVFIPQIYNRLVEMNDDRSRNWTYCLQFKTPCCCQFCHSQTCYMKNVFFNMQNLQSTHPSTDHTLYNHCTSFGEQTKWKLQFLTHTQNFNIKK